MAQPLGQASEVMAGGGQYGIDAVSLAAFEIIPVQSMVFLEMPDNGFNGGAAPEFAFDLSVDAALLP